LGKGRVWSGNDAIKIHLVDEIGGIDKAIEICCPNGQSQQVSHHLLTGTEGTFTGKYWIIFLAMPRPPFLKHQVGDSYKYYQQLQTILKQNGIQTRMEYDLDIN